MSTYCVYEYVLQYIVRNNYSIRHWPRGIWHSWEISFIPIRLTLSHPITPHPPPTLSHQYHTSSPPPPYHTPITPHPPHPITPHPPHPITPNFHTKIRLTLSHQYHPLWPSPFTSLLPFPPFLPPFQIFQYLCFFPLLNFFHPLHFFPHSILHPHYTSSYPFFPPLSLPIIPAFYSCHSPILFTISICSPRLFPPPCPSVYSSPLLFKPFCSLLFLHCSLLSLILIFSLPLFLQSYLHSFLPFFNPLFLYSYIPSFLASESSSWERVHHRRRIKIEEKAKAIASV